MRIIGFDQISRAGKLCIYSSLLFFPFLFKGRSPWSYVTPTCAFRSGSHQEKSCKRGCRLSVTVVVRAHTAQQRTGDTDLRSGTRTGIGRTVHSSPFRQQERSASAKRRGGLQYTFRITRPASSQEATLFPYRWVLKKTGKGHKHRNVMDEYLRTTFSIR